MNYDLPWNPQRIEQRIGRCHRYGQKHDVVVINFLNEKNEADRRVHELLEEKFNLFNGVLGASDDVLGTIESGVDFEDVHARLRLNRRRKAKKLQVKKRSGGVRHRQRPSMNGLRVDRREPLSHFDS